MSSYPNTIKELSKLLAEKKISAREITQHQFNQIQKKEESIHAFITVCKEEALKQAEKIDEKRMAGEELSPIAGVPIGIKDNICTKGIRTTCASRMLQDFIPPYDATVVSKLKNADAIILGKMNMDEFAMGSSSETSYFGPVRNPHDTSKVPGGSSGGSAAAVASCEAYAALGSDTGGSIRQPASLCGVVGLKPTYGRVSRYGLIAYASSLDQIGPLARNAYDTALIYSQISGKDPLDATSRDDLPSLSSLPEDSLESLKGLKIGLPEEYFTTRIDEEVCNAIVQVAELLQKHGATLVRTSFADAKYALSAYRIISCAEASSNLARFDGVRYGYRTKEYQNLTEMYEKSRSKGFGDEVKRRIMLGTFVLSSGYYDAYYNRAKKLQRDMICLMQEQLSQADMILMPTSPNTAFPIGEEAEDPIRMSYNDFCTVIANIAGLPALSFPCGKDNKGLPIGAQLIGKEGAEERLLQTAHCYELLTEGKETVREGQEVK